jgi:alanyl-tRNA synthetase
MTGIEKRQLDIDTAMRVIADHIRALTFAIGDGAIPSNEGRGYVLRRLLRRASRFGRNLDVHEPFVHTLVPTLVATMGSVFPEIREKQDYIQKIIKGEEDSFSATLENGIREFADVALNTLVKYLRTSGYEAEIENTGLEARLRVTEKKDLASFATLKERSIYSLADWDVALSKKYFKDVPVISGEDGFKLYDTYGFPLDLTQLMAKERGMEVDEPGFHELMNRQREHSRKFTTVHVGSSAFVANDLSVPDSEFVGYDELETVTQSYAHSQYPDGSLKEVILYKTPFYAESGGQVGDRGVLISDNLELQVIDTQKIGGQILHVLEPHPQKVPKSSDVIARVEKERRFSIMRNHTATHLVHAALRQILGAHVHQAGSLVAPDYLRFDFAHFAKVSDAELSDIESLVNEKIKEDIKLSHYRNIPFEQAKKMGALMFFGDKYGDRVNVVEFSEFSREFCGGTHVESTAEIGYFKFRSEGSVASGIRRIEAVTAEHALELLRLQDRNATERIEYAEGQLQETTAIQRQLGEQAAGDTLTFVRKKLDALKSSPNAPERVTLDLQGHFAQRAQRGFDIEGLVLEIAEIKRTLEKVASKQRLQSQSGLIENLVRHATLINGLKVVSSRVEASTSDELKMLGDTLRARLGSGVGLLASVLDDKVSLVCVVTDDLVASKRLEAGKVVAAVARIVGGGGGGKAHLATAGGKDVSKLAEALRATETVVKSFLKN